MPVLDRPCRGGITGEGSLVLPRVLRWEVGVQKGLHVGEGPGHLHLISDQHREEDTGQLVSQRGCGQGAVVTGAWWGHQGWTCMNARDPGTPEPGQATSAEERRGVPQLVHQGPHPPTHTHTHTTQENREGKTSEPTPDQGEAERGPETDPRPWWASEECLR